MVEPTPLFTSRLNQFSDQRRQRSAIPQQVATFVHDLIVAGELKPGDRVVESRLARSMGIGHPTVREALVALEHQGLVVRKANQGCVVTTLTPKEIQQILEVRSHLEVVAVELAAGNATPPELEALAGAANDMRAAGQAGDIEQFYKCDLNFHDTLWRMSENPFLVRSLTQLMVPLLAFCMLKNLRHYGYLDMVQSADAHAEIAAAVATGDKKLAGRVAREKFEVFARQHTRGDQPQPDGQ
jgi:DNA-binding GntR family transcriptional regulator